jgi:hypothetical protein
MVRACAPGGRVVSAAWTPDGFMAATNRAMGRYLPPPPSCGQPPTRWGDTAFVRGLFAGAGTVSTSVERVEFTFASAQEAAAFWVRVAGHVQVERARLEGEGSWEALHEDVVAAFSEWNQARPGSSPDTGAGVRVESAYLLATVTRAG